MVKKLWQHSLIVLIALLLGSTISSAEEVMNMGGHSSFPPLTWQEGDKIVGAAIDVMTQIFHEFGVDVDSNHVLPWKRMLVYLEEGELDMACGLLMSAERQQVFEFTGAFCEDRAAIFVWKGREFPFESLKDLEGKIVGDIIGSNRGQVFEDWKKTYAKMEYVSTNEQNLKKLEAGRIDCFVTSPYIAIPAIKALGYQEQLIELPTPISTHELYCAMSKKSRFVKYLPEINKRLETLRQDGTIDRLMHTTLERYYQTPQQ